MSPELRFGWVAKGDSLPDEDITVLIAMKDGEVWPAFMCEGAWLYICGGAIDPCRITHWMDIPEAPAAKVAA